MVDIKRGEFMALRRGRIAELVGLLAGVSLALCGCGGSNKASNQGGVEPEAHAQAGIPMETGPREPIGDERVGIRLVYPHDGSSIAAPSTYMTGAVAPGTSLAVNGQPVKVNAQGFFAHVLPLAIGQNKFDVVRADGGGTFSFVVNRPLPPKPVPDSPLQILKNSMVPKQDLGGQTGDIIVFAMRGSPGAKGWVKLGEHVIPLTAGGLTGKVNLGLDTTFGVQFQKTSGPGKDYYSGFYKLAPSDSFQDLRPEFYLSRDGSTVHMKAPATVSVLGQPFVRVVRDDNTIVRVGPDAGRTTPWAAGVRVLVDGWFGESVRCEVAPNHHLWLERAALDRDGDGGLPPTTSVQTINIENEGDGGARVVIPLNQRLPYEIRQELAPYNKLTLKVYGATANTDWVTEPATSSNAVGEASAAAPHGSAMPAKGDRTRNPVTYVSWQQMADRIYQVQINLGTKSQWGHWVTYEGTNLVVHVKGAPNLPLLSQGSLQGLRICVDPGHGGKETGAIGCSGVKESTINLAIGLKVERLLREMGAEVIMTRKQDIDVSLQDRVATAVSARADLLLSIHGNSLPDGRNPWTEHGTSSYYYHPQSRGYANDVRAGAVEKLGFPDYNTRWQNLALCRPTQMPACLVEVGFVINPDEYATMLSQDGQERAARGITSGVRNFLRSSLVNASSSAPGGAPTDPN